MKWLRSILLCSIVLSFLQLNAQESSNKGTEFYVGFMDHIDGSNASLDLYITSDSNTTGTVSIPGQSWSTTFSVTANQMTLVSVPSASAHVNCGDCKQDRGIKVTSQKPVVVYSHIYNNFRSDATLVLPVNSTGQTYFVMSYTQESNGQHSQFMVIASQDNTKVRITPTDNVGSRPANTSYEVTLNAGEVYQGQAPSLNDDLTGTKIEVIDTGANASCKRVSVFAGSSFTKLGCTGSFGSGDNLYQQLYPVSSWSNSFVTVPFKGRNHDRFRILASQDNTVVLIDGKFVAFLNEGQYYETGNVNKPQYIFGSKPISVAQFQVTQLCGGLGDPSMTILSPVQQTLKKITLYSSEYEDIDDNYINVIMPTADTSTFKIDGKKVPFKTVAPLPAYSYAQIDVNSGNQTLEADEGFLAIAYGFGTVESYGYSAGANVTNLNQFISLDDYKISNINTICLGETAKFEGNANFAVAKWEWKFGDDSTSTLRNPNHTYKDTGTYLVKMYTTKPSFDGCSLKDSAEITVKVVNVPKGSFSFQDQCVGDTVQFIDSVYTDAPAIVNFRLWDFGEGTRAFATRPKHVYDTAGFYPISLQVKNSYECSSFFRDTLEVFPLPVVKFSAEGSCFKDSVALFDSSTSNAYPIVQRIWDFGEGNKDTVTSQTHQYLYDTFGDFTIRLTSITAKGCSQSADSVFKKYKPFKVDIGVTDVCLKDQVRAIDSSIFLQEAAMSRKWKWNDSLLSMDSLLVYQPTNSGSYSLKLVVKQNSFCSDSIEKTVAIHPQLRLSYTAKNTCFMDSTELEVQSIPNYASSDSFWWHLNGYQLVGNTIKHLFRDTGINEGILYSKTSFGCLDTLNLEQVIKPKPAAKFITNVPCMNDSLVLVNTSEDYMKGLISVTWTTSTSSSLGNPDTFAYQLGTQNRETVQLVVSSSEGCTDSIVQELIVYPRPKISISTRDVCLGEKSSFTNQSSEDSGRIVAWRWDLGNGSVSFDSLPDVTYGSSQSYLVKLLVRSSTGCDNEDSVRFVVNPLPKVDFHFQNVCYGELTPLEDRSSVPNGALKNTRFYFSDGSSITGPNATYQFSAPGTYTVKNVVESSVGCKDSISYQVLSHFLPKANFGLNESEGCAPFMINFIDSSTIATGEIVEWRWKTESEVVSSMQNYQHQYINAGTKDIQLLVKSDSGCLDSIQKLAVAKIYPKPKAIFSYSPTAPSIIENEVQFTDLSVNSVFWNWSFGDGGASNEQYPSNEYKDTGLFNVRLEILDSNQCVGDTQLEVYIQPAFFVFTPNSFTPNGDGLNETWGPEGVLEGVLGYELQIFNRWGEILFESKDPSKRWDGKYQGSLVQEGHYGYRMRYTDYTRLKWYNQKGTIYLMR